MTNLEKIEALANGNKTEIAVLKANFENFKKTLDEIRISQVALDTKIDTFMTKVALKEELKLIRWGLMVFFLIILIITASDFSQKLLQIFHL